MKKFERQMSVQEGNSLSSESDKSWDDTYKGPIMTPEYRVVDPETGGEKGQKDVRLHAAPYEALAELGRVFAFGEEKYDDYNFRKGYAWSLSYDALIRHALLFWAREDRDHESRLHHMAHATWHCIVLVFFSLTGRGTDDRPV